MTDTNTLREALENTPGTMVILPTPGTSGNRKTIVRIPLHRLEALVKAEKEQLLNDLLKGKEIYVKDAHTGHLGVPISVIKQARETINNHKEAL